MLNTKPRISYNKHKQKWIAHASHNNAYSHCAGTTPAEAYTKLIEKVKKWPVKNNGTRRLFECTQGAANLEHDGAVYIEPEVQAAYYKWVFKCQYSN